MARYPYIKRILQAYVFNYRRSNLCFWHTELFANRLTADDRRHLGRYPMNFSNKTGYNRHLDDDGVIRLDYGGKIGVQYNPNAIAQMALGCYDLFVTMKGNRDVRKRFLSHADWFVRNGRMVRDGVRLWEYNFPFEMREFLQKPWRSALAQGQALSVLLRAHAQTGDERYLRAAHQGFNAFRYDALAHEGGVIYRQGANVWLEEVILQQPNHILNGFVWALWGVRDFAVAVGDPWACSLYEQAQETLARKLDRYDLGFWTCYDDIPRGSGPVMPASRYYQRLHTIQMRGMYELTRRPIYFQRYSRWLAYYRQPLFTAIALCWKVFFKLRYW